MRTLPSGTVTFLFTDVEGSTRLLHELGAEAYAAALGEHRRVLRESFARHGGVEVDTQGDAFFVAFPTAPGALAAAAELTLALEHGPIRVRVGVHTGTPLVTAEGYVGEDVHRAARIAATGHGGQVLVSAAAAALCDDQSQGGFALRDLGDHRLKDLQAAERVFQLGNGVFPALKSLYRSNLPVPATAFLGRERELAEVVEVLTRDDVRLLTLTGPGGTGKTRLALQAAAEAAEHYPDGVWWVPLAPLRDPELVVPELARALGVKETVSSSVLDAVLAALGGGRTLVLLDNAEHLLPELATVVADLVDRCPAVGVLATSRERLRVRAEQAYAVPSLSPSDATELFVARARQVEVSFAPTPAVTELCTRLDDLPLALELAAARTAVFSPQELLDRLAQRLDLLRGGRDADPRQQTLRGTIEWSTDLLDEEERRLLRRLSVFAGGCTFEAAEVVCAADPDTLQSLIDKSLVRRRDTADGARYWMLETIHEFAAEQLQPEEEHVLRLRHAAFVADLVERADPDLRHGPDQQGWARRLVAEYGNVRAAMRFALDQASPLALRIVGGLAFFVWLRGGFAEARAWVEAALAAGADEPDGLRARALESGAVVAERQGDLRAHQVYADAAYAAYDAAGDGPGKASALRERGKAAIAGGEQDRARAIYEELVRLAEEVGDPWNGAIALNNLGDLALYDGDWERTIELCGRSSGLRRGIGDRWGAALALVNVATAQLCAGRPQDAARSLRQALSESTDVGATMVVTSALQVSAGVAVAIGRERDAARLLGAFGRSLDELGSRLEQFERDQLERTEALLVERLGQSAFDAELEAGRALSLDE
ncbi:MAG TPA: adenylate/guanylate cyclase domain-containing protein, partial [Gaiellaceae bacterium]|nr:adenylate/guanylate cyclase domain-containing protein [Gaiellaceae bacterium]